MNCNGRSIRATFNLVAGTKIVFFAGKATGKLYPSGQFNRVEVVVHQCLLFNPPNPNVLTAHVVAAGGGAGFNTRYDYFCAPSLNTNIPQIINERDAAFSNINIGTSCGKRNDGGGGFGRGPASAPAQGGGAGMALVMILVLRKLFCESNTKHRSEWWLWYCICFKSGAMGARVHHHLVVFLVDLVVVEWIWME